MTDDNYTANGKALYLALYEREGGIWDDVNPEHQKLWCDYAVGYEQRKRDAAPKTEGDNQ